MKPENAVNIPLARTPQVYRIVVLAIYLAAVVWLGLLAGGTAGLLACVLTAGLSFQFWTYATWRGLTKHYWLVPKSEAEVK